MRLTRRLSAYLPEGGFRRGVVTLAGGTALAQGIVVLSSPILTRLYQPQDFGSYAAALSLMALLMTVSCLGYDAAIGLPADDDVAANVLALCFVTTIGIGIAAGIVLTLAGGQILGFFGASELAPFVFLLVAGQLGGASVSALTIWALRVKAFSHLAANSLTQTGSLVAVQIGAGLAGWGAPGLLGGAVIGSIAGAARLGHVAWRGSAASLRRVSRVGILQVATRYRRFAIFTTPSLLLNTLGLRAPLLIIVAVFGAEVGGQFALAERVIALPVTLVAGAVGNVFYAHAAPLARQEGPELRSLFLGTIRSLTRLGIPLAIVAAIGAPLFFGTVFGGPWTEAGVFVAVMAPWYCLMLITRPTGAALDVLERQDLHLIGEIVRLVVIGCGAIVIVALGLSPVQAVAVMSVTGCFNYAVFGLMSWRAIATRATHPLHPADDERRPDLPGATVS